MSREALIFMITVQGTVTAIVAYFFIKVLRTPAKPPEEDDDADSVE